MALEIDGKKITEIRIGGELVVKKEDAVELEFVWGTYTEKLAKIWVQTNMSSSALFEVFSMAKEIGAPIENNQKVYYDVRNFNHAKIIEGTLIVFDINGVEIADKIVILENDGCLVKQKNDYWKIVGAGKAKIQINA